MAIKYEAFSKRHFKLLFLFTGLFFLNGVFGQDTINGNRLGLTPEWVKKYPQPKLTETDEHICIQREIQYNHVSKECFYKQYYYVDNTKDLSKIGAFTLKYNPDFNSILINEVNVYRNGKLINLLDQLHIEERKEKKTIGGEKYHNLVFIDIFLDRIEKGDLIEISYTKKGVQPDMHGSLNLQILRKHFYNEGVVYCRLLMPKGAPLEYKVLNSNSKPKKTETKKFTILEYHIPKADEEENYEPPSWYIKDGGIIFYDIPSWEAFVELNLRNFELEEETSALVKNKVEESTKDEKSMEQKVSNVLDYIQKDIEYLSYGLIDPKPPEMVVRQNLWRL